MAFRDGILVYSQPGAMPQPAFEELITKVKDLDMDQVRATIAARKADADAHDNIGRKAPGTPGGS
jgi:hypothetical protein